VIETEGFNAEQQAEAEPEEGDEVVAAALAVDPEG
jgi:hypothetical protein